MKASQPLRVLIVSDDPYEAGTLASSIRKELPARSTVRHANAIQGAMEWVNKERYHAVVVSQDLPDGKGVSLIGSLLIMPRKPDGLFLITEGVPRDIEVIRLLKDHPEVSLLVKPFKFPAAATLVRNALVPPQSTEQSYYGLRLMDLIQAFSLGRRSATLQIIMPDHKLAAIYIQKGELVHVVYGEEEGKSALVRIMLSKKGQIRVEKGCPTAKHSITEPTQHVLIDIYRQLDESKRSSALDEDLDQVPEPTVEEMLNDAFDIKP